MYAYLAKQILVLRANINRKIKYTTKYTHIPRETYKSRNESPYIARMFGNKSTRMYAYLAKKVLVLRANVNRKIKYTTQYTHVPRDTYKSRNESQYIARMFGGRSAYVKLILILRANATRQANTRKNIHIYLAIQISREMSLNTSRVCSGGEVHMYTYLAKQILILRANARSVLYACCVCVRERERVCVCVCVRVRVCVCVFVRVSRHTYE